MNWQDIAVALVGVALVWIVVRRLFCRGRGTLSGGCASCERNCPLHDLKSSDKKRPTQKRIFEVGFFA